jgi:hypothetical protein
MLFSTPFSARRSAPLTARGPAVVARAFVLLGLISTLVLPAAAQDLPTETSSSDPGISGQINLRGTAGVPTGGFGTNIGTGGGLHLFIGGYMDRAPVSIGLDVGFVTYGRTVDTVPLSGTIGPRAQVDVETSNSLVQPHLVVRLQPKTGRVRPFVDGLVGFKYLFTRTSVQDDAPFDDDGDTFVSTTNYDDFAFSAGAGAGVDVRVYTHDDPAKEVRTVSLHLGVQYLWGQQATYLSEGNLVDQNGNGHLDGEELRVQESRTSLLQPQLGVTIQL